MLRGIFEFLGLAPIAPSEPVEGGANEKYFRQWQELKLEVEGNRFRGYLSGQLVVEATDDAFAAGGVGLWTKADSVTCFDDFRVTAK